MGAITFSIDPNLVRFLTDAVAFDAFVETGTYRGDTVERVRPYFSEIISIECAEPYYRAAVSKFQGDEAVTLVHGDSREVLSDLVDQLQQKAVLFWLDAHWCADENTAGASAQCPLLQELEAIGRLNDKSILLIDDARFFLAPPGKPHHYAQWPSLAEVLQGLQRLSKKHELLVINDVMAYYPRRLRKTMQTFAHEQGVDWLSVADRSRDYEKLLQEIESKELEIKEIHKAAEERLQRIYQFQIDLQSTEEVVQARERELAAKDEVVAGKEEVIQTQQQTLLAHENALAARDSELAAKEEVIQTQQQTLLARTDELAARDGKLAARKNEVIAGKEEVIQTQQQALLAHENELAAHENELAARDSELAAKEEVIQTQQQTLLAHENELAARDSELAAKEEVIQTQQQTLLAHENELAARDSELAAKEEVIQTQQQTLLAHENELAARDSELAAKEEVIQTQQQTLLAHENELAAKEEVIQTQQQTLLAHENELAARDSELAAKEEVIQTQQQALLAHENELAAKDEVIAGKNEVIQTQQQTLLVHENELAAKDEVIANQSQTIADQDDVVAGGRAELATLAQTLTVRDETIRSRDEELAAGAEAIRAGERLLRMKELELEEKDEVLADSAATIARKDQELRDKEDVVQQQHRDLIAKEEILQQLESFRRTSLRYWFSYVFLGWLKQIARFLLRLVGRPRRTLREALRPRLGVLEQHAPIPLRLPRRYHTVRCTMDAPPRISVVTPSFNHAAYLERTVQSVLQQPYPNLEYILQDGGSTDGTDEILDRYRTQCSHVESRRDRGQAHAINLGFEHATGEIMAWLNSDDLLLPGALPYVANYFDRHPDVDVVYGHRILIDEQDREIGRWVLPAHDEEILKWADYVPQETLFWRRRLWEEVGSTLDESFKFALDWDLLLRFQAAGARFVRLPRFLGAFRIYEEQKTSDWMDVGQQEMKRLRVRANGTEVTWPEVNDAIRPYLRRSVFVHLLHQAGLRRF